MNLRRNQLNREKNDSFCVIIDSIVIMAEMYLLPKAENAYYDRKNYNSLEEYQAALEVSTTVYVGNLSFFTTQDSIR